MLNQIHIRYMILIEGLSGTGWYDIFMYIYVCLCFFLFVVCCFVFKKKDQVSQIVWEYGWKIYKTCSYYIKKPW